MGRMKDLLLYIEEQENKVDEEPYIDPKLESMGLDQEQLDRLVAGFRAFKGGNNNGE